MRRLVPSWCNELSIIVNIAVTLSERAMLALKKPEPRLEAYKYLMKKGLVTCRGLIFFNLLQLYPKASWEHGLLKICDAWSRSHVHTTLKQMENEKIVRSWKEESTGRIGYRITEKEFEEFTGLLRWSMSQYLPSASA